eukprot:c25332_g3_i1 orf=177-389(+)
MAITLLHSHCFLLRFNTHPPRQESFSLPFPTQITSPVTKLLPALSYTNHFVSRCPLAPNLTTIHLHSHIS